MKVDIVDINSIVDGTRARLDYGNLDELEISIRERGLIHPIAVEDVGGVLTLLAGGRRLRASRNIGMEKMPVRIYTNLTEIDRRSIELEENIKRKDMSWQEQTTLIHQLHNLKQEQFGISMPGPGNEGWGISDTAKLLNIAESSVSESIKIAKALDLNIPEIQKAKGITEAKAVVRKLSRQLDNSVRADKFESTQGSDSTKKIISGYVIGDCFEQMAMITAEQFDLIEIDPPYAIDYSSHTRSESVKVERAEYVEVEKLDYTDFLARLLKEAKRLVKPTGWIILWCPTNWLDIATPLCNVIGLEVTTPAVWTKTGAASTLNPKYILGNSYEPFVYLRKSPEATINRPGRRNVFQYDAPTNRIHPTERPVELMVDIITTFARPLGYLLVPFLGSGNTLIAANTAKMNAVGFDLVKEYRDAFIARLESSSNNGV